MNGNRVRIEVRIVNPDTGKVLGEASQETQLRTDLLTSAFASTAQDWFVTTCGAVGTTAYRSAFPRSGQGEARP
jgi:hypothetical protein